MNYGYTMGTAGLIAAMHRQDVAANNLANIQTVGFKPDTSFTIPRMAVRQEDGVMNLPSNALLERLGASVLLAPDQTSFTQGPITSTHNPFDLAIQGDGFLMVSPSGTTGAAGGDSLRLTRDGRLAMNSDGKLVTATGGYQVLDANGRPITLNPAQSFDVDTDGTISQDGQTVAKLGFVDVPRRDVLRKAGDSMFSLSAAAATSRMPATGRVLQYSTEESGADPIRAMMAVQGAADAVSATAKIMQIHDDLMNRAINTLGRVTG
jgi:flagellar basal body rod protein FlgG